MKSHSWDLRRSCSEHASAGCNDEMCSSQCCSEQKASKQAKLLSTAEILELGDVCNYIIINADMVRSSGSISQAALHIVVRQSV